MSSKNLKCLALALCVGAFGPVVPVGAGDLNPPPGPIQPTMKDLDTVEPRIPISSVPYTISDSGSYYFTGDLQVNPATPTDGITVDADHVTIDLMGYSLVGPGVGSGVNHGIHMYERRNVEIRNGTVREFGSHGIYAAYGDVGRDHRIIGIRAVSNGEFGIQLEGEGFLVKDCTAARNGSTGISAGSRSVVTGNNAYENAGTGIATASATVTGNTVSLNVWGIVAGSSSTVTGNTAYANENDGIKVSYGCTVTGNTAMTNNQSNTTGSAGIKADVGCFVHGNTLWHNNQNNIRVNGSDNAVTENLVIGSNGYGIYFAGGNFYANNRASGNSTNYGGSVPTGGGDGGGNAQF